MSSFSRFLPPFEWQCLARGDSPATMVLLGENAIKSMGPGRFFREHKGAVNSLDFHHTEDVMVTVGK